MRQTQKLAFKLMLLAIVLARVGHAQVVPGVTINFEQLSPVPLGPTVSAALAAALAVLSVVALRRKRRVLGATLALGALVAAWPVLIQEASAQSNTPLSLVTSPVHAAGPGECDEGPIDQASYYILTCNVPGGLRFLSFVPDEPDIVAGGECTGLSTLAFGQVCELIVTKRCSDPS